MITIAAAVVGTMAMLFALATSDPDFRAEFSAEWSLIMAKLGLAPSSYKAHHRADGSGAPYWQTAGVR